MTTKHSSRDIHTRIYHKLLDVVPDLLTIEESGKSKVEGFMDLNFDPGLSISNSEVSFAPRMMLNA